MINTAYYVSNIADVARWGRVAEVVEVEIMLISLVRPLARVRFSSGRVDWVSFASLASTQELLDEKLQLLEDIYNELNTKETT